MFEEFQEDTTNTQFSNASEGSLTEYANTQDSNLNTQDSKKRGAPYGNQNAYKHGFYARHFTPQEVTDFEEMEPLDVLNEIELVRVLMRRVVESLESATTHAENLDTLRAICQGNFTLSRLIRTQFLKPKDPMDTLHGILGEMLRELDEEQAQENQERRERENANGDFKFDMFPPLQP
jgi:hypothetical protein